MLLWLRPMATPDKALWLSLGPRLPRWAGAFLCYRVSDPWRPPTQALWLASIRRYFRARRIGAFLRGRTVCVAPRNCQWGKGRAVIHAHMAKKKDPAAVSLGRRGGHARAKRLTPAERREGARKAAEARWAKQKNEANQR